MRLGGFWKAGQGGAKPDPAAAARLKDWTRAALALPEEATVSANEIICADPACPGTETVILVMVPGRRTRAYKLTGAMVEATEAAVAAAVDKADEGKS